MFTVLLHRETTHRTGEALAEWARSTGYRVRSEKIQLPPALSAFEPGVRLSTIAAGKKCSLVRFAVDRATPPSGAVAVAASARPTRGRWRHVLIWPVDRNWTAVGLRPVSANDPLINLLGLPAQMAEGNQRFSVCTVDRKLAHRLAGTSARGLLPADVGLILIGPHMLLDFSDRPFDGIEFNRMIAVAEQVAASLAGIASQ